LGEDVNDLVVAGGHFDFERVEAFFKNSKPLATTGDKTASLHREEKNSTGKNADDTEFFDPQQEINVRNPSGQWYRKTKLGTLA